MPEEMACSAASRLVLRTLYYILINILKQKKSCLIRKSTLIAICCSFLLPGSFQNYWTCINYIYYIMGLST